MSRRQEHSGLTGQWMYYVAVPGAVNFIATSYEAARRFVLMVTEGHDSTVIQDPVRHRTFRGSKVTEDYFADLRPGEHLSVVRGAAHPPIDVRCTSTLRAGDFDESEEIDDRNKLLEDMAARFLLIELD